MYGKHAIKMKQLVTVHTRGLHVLKIRKNA